LSKVPNISQLSKNNNSRNFIKNVFDTGLDHDPIKVMHPKLLDGFNSEFKGEDNGRRGIGCVLWLVALQG
jgi:hypothetical protein